MCQRLTPDGIFSLSQPSTQYSRGFNRNQLANMMGSSSVKKKPHLDAPFIEITLKVLLEILCSKWQSFFIGLRPKKKKKGRKTCRRGWDHMHTPRFIYLVTLKIASLHGVSLLLTSACSSKRCILLPSSAVGNPRQHAWAAQNKLSLKTWASYKIVFRGSLMSTNLSESRFHAVRLRRCTFFFLQCAD